MPFDTGKYLPMNSQRHVALLFSMINIIWKQVWRIFGKYFNVCDSGISINLLSVFFPMGWIKLQSDIQLWEIFARICLLLVQDPSSQKIHFSLDDNALFMPPVLSVSTHIELSSRMKHPACKIRTKYPMRTLGTHWELQVLPSNQTWMHLFSIAMPGSPLLLHCPILLLF